MSMIDLASINGLAGCFLVPMLILSLPLTWINGPWNGEQ